MVDDVQGGRLAQGSIGLRQVLGEGLVSNGPLASVTVALTSAAFFGLGSLPLVFIGGGIVFAIYINTLRQWSRHIQTSGAGYSFSKQGLGRRLGFGNSTAYLASYIGIIAANAVFGASVIQGVTGVFGYTLPYWWWVPVALIFLAVPFGLASLSVRPALNYGVVTAGLELGTLVILSIVLIIHAGHHNTGVVFTPKYGLNGISGLIIGAFVAGNALGGPDAIIGLGEEARAPERTIRRGLLVSLATLVLFYVLVSYALTVAWGPSHMSTFATSGTPGLTLVGGVWGKVGVFVVGLLIVNSFIGVNMGCTMFAARQVLDVARDGHLWRGLTRVSDRHKEPVNALVACLVAEVVLALGAGLIWGPLTGGIVLVVLSTAGEIFNWLGLHAALIRYALPRHKSVLTYIALPAVGVLAAGYGIYANFFPLSFPNAYGPALVVVLIGVAIYFGTRSYRHATPQEDGAARSEV